jgi:hypothetical protein
VGVRYEDAEPSGKIAISFPKRKAARRLPNDPKVTCGLLLRFVWSCHNSLGLARNRDLTRSFALGYPAKPLVRRISVVTAIDPRFVGDGQRRRRDAPNEYDSKQRGDARNSGTCPILSGRLNARSPARLRSSLFAPR